MPVPIPGPHTTEPCTAASCGMVGSVGQSILNGTLGGIATEIQQAVGWVVKFVITGWIAEPSGGGASLQAEAALHTWTLPVTAGVAVSCTLVAAARMAISRRMSSLAGVVFGLVAIAVAETLGLALTNLLLRAGDAWSTWVVNAAAGRQFEAKLTTALTMPGAPAGVVVVLGIVAIAVCALQAVLMLFRSATIVILAGVLPLAAAGTMAPATSAWMRKVTGWLLALIFYKPVAAMVYATAFTLLGAASGVNQMLVGYAAVALSVAALPALMRLFSWTTGAVGVESPGEGLLGTAVTGAALAGAFRGDDAASYARYVRTVGGGAARAAPPMPGAPTGGVPGGPGAGEPSRDEPRTEL